MDETNSPIPNPYENLTHVPPIIPPAASTSSTGGTSQSTRTLVTILLLIFAGPIGFFVMWFWSKWKVWVKLLVSFLGLIITLLILAPIVLIAVNPAEQIRKAGCAQLCKNSAPTDTSCLEKCLEVNTTANTEGDNGSIETFKEAYMKSCLSSSGEKQVYCECTLEYLEGVIDFSNAATLVTSLPKQIPNAIQSCKSKNL